MSPEAMPVPPTPQVVQMTTEQLAAFAREVKDAAVAEVRAEFENSGEIAPKRIRTIPPEWSTEPTGDINDRVARIEAMMKHMWPSKASRFIYAGRKQS